MVTRNSTRLAVGAVLIAIAAATLSGCAQPQATAVPKGDYPELSLADSKAPAQLLRNTAAGRFPADVVLTTGTGLDGSVACLSAADDPDGYIRQWSSTIDVNLVADQVVNADQIVSDLVSTFVDTGWMAQATAGGKGGGHATLLTNGATDMDSVSQTRLRLEPIIASNNVSGFVRIEVTGPCVVTEGANSRPVKDLGKL